MESNSNQRLSDRFADIERWMIPILLLLILVVGIIRITPWVKETLFTSTTEVVTTTAHSNERPTEIGVDIELAPIILEEDKGLPETRSEDLTNTLNEINETLTIDLQTEAANNILTSRPKIDPVIDSEQPPKGIVSTSNSEKTEKIADKPTEAAPEINIVDSTEITQIELDKTDNNTLANLTEPSKMQAPESEAVDISPIKDIEALINQWATAWSNKDINSYLAAYTDDHEGRNHSTAAEWREWRKQRLLAPPFIQVSLTNNKISYNDSNPNIASALFTQDYKTPQFSDTVIKRLEFKKHATGWKITSERTIQTLKVTRS